MTSNLIVLRLLLQPISPPIFDRKVLVGHHGSVTDHVQHLFLWPSSAVGPNTPGSHDIASSFYLKPVLTDLI